LWWSDGRDSELSETVRSRKSILESHLGQSKATFGEGAQ